MANETRCMGCMADRGDSAKCPECGWVEGTSPEVALYLPPRTILKSQYLLGRVLGHGGFGITYLGWDRRLETKVAVKEYLPSGLATRAGDNPTVSVFTGDKREHFAYGLKKFLEEARALGRFQDHPGISTVVNFFEANGTGYLVMQYVEGLTLKQYLGDHGGKLTFKKTLDILMPVMDALREVHGADLLHRDISPDNIYITSTGQVKLLDFGAARYLAGEASKSLSVVLKPGYAPEEHYRSKGKQGPWTDEYALAATFYRCITGQIPPDALNRLNEDEIKTPQSLGCELPPDSEIALMKALSVRASERFGRIEEFQNTVSVDNLQGKQTNYGNASSTDGANIKDDKDPKFDSRKKIGSLKAIIGVLTIALVLLLLGLIPLIHAYLEAKDRSNILDNLYLERRAAYEKKAEELEVNILESEELFQLLDQSIGRRHGDIGVLEMLNDSYKAGEEFVYVLYIGNKNSTISTGSIFKYRMEDNDDGEMNIISTLWGESPTVYQGRCSDTPELYFSIFSGESGEESLGLNDLIFLGTAIKPIHLKVAKELDQKDERSFNMSYVDGSKIGH